MKKGKTNAKKLLGAALIVCIALSFGACKKTYDCHCVKTAGGDEETEIKAKSKSDAESECTAKKTNNSSTYKECHLD